MAVVYSGWNKSKKTASRTPASTSRSLSLTVRGSPWWQADLVLRGSSWCQAVLVLRLLDRWTRPRCHARTERTSTSWHYAGSSTSTLVSTSVSAPITPATLSVVSTSQSFHVSIYYHHDTQFLYAIVEQEAQLLQRGRARHSVAVEILLSHSRSLEVTRNYTVPLSRACVRY